MRDVVVIGGGLSGLSACYELEKQSQRYTVIEVKRRFGGGIRSTTEGGFLLDASAFVFQSLAAEPSLDELGLQEQIIKIDTDTCVFPDGTQSLINALAGKLNGGRLMRMAVSSIGSWGDRFTLCLENGLLYDAGALILAVPARYAARMLYNLLPTTAQQLQAYRYDSIYRLSLGYHKRDLPPQLGEASEPLFPFLLTTDAPSRLPSRDHQLIQLGLRCQTAPTLEQALHTASAHYDWLGSPLVACLDHWPEADSLSCYDQDHPENIRAIQAALPAGISLIGSDYCLQAPASPGIARLDGRIRAGRLAARAAIAHLKSKRNR